MKTPSSTTSLRPLQLRKIRDCRGGRVAGDIQGRDVLGAQDKHTPDVVLQNEADDGRWEGEPTPTAPETCRRVRRVRNETSQSEHEPLETTVTSLEGIRRRSLKERSLSMQNSFERVIRAFFFQAVEVLQGDGLADVAAKDADVGRERLGFCLKKLRGQVEDSDDLLRALGRGDGEQLVDCASTPDVRRLSRCGGRATLL